MGAARITAGLTSRAIAQSIEQMQLRKLLRRPKGVPKDWIAKRTKSGKGMEFRDPTNRGTYVRTQKGNPNASRPGQRYDNVRFQKNGQSYDVSGNKIVQDSLESHIPLKDFKFPLELLNE